METVTGLEEEKRGGWLESLPLCEGEQSWLRLALLGPAAGVSDTPRDQASVPSGSASAPTPALLLSCSVCVDKRPSRPPSLSGSHISGERGRFAPGLGGCEPETQEAGPQRHVHVLNGKGLDGRSSGPPAKVPAPASSQRNRRQDKCAHDSLPGKTRGQAVSGGSLGRPFGHDNCPLSWPPDIRPLLPVPELTPAALSLMASSSQNAKSPADRSIHEFCGASCPGWGGHRDSFQASGHPTPPHPSICPGRGELTKRNVGLPIPQPESHRSPEKQGRHREGLDVMPPLPQLHQALIGTILISREGALQMQFPASAHMESTAPHLPRSMSGLRAVSLSVSFTTA